MYHHRLRPAVVHRGERIGVENAASAIAVGVDQHENMLVGRAGQEVVHVFEMCGGEVSFAVIGVPMRAECRVFPYSLARFAGPAILGWRFYRHDVEVAAHALVRLMGEESVHRCAGVGDKNIHLRGRIALGKKCEMYTVGGVFGLLQHLEGGHVAIADGAYEDVFGHHLVGGRGRDLASVVAQVYRDVGGIFGHRHEKHVLKGFVGACGLGLLLPFLEERGE